MDQLAVWPLQQPNGVVSEHVLQQLAKELVTVPPADAAPAAQRDDSSQVIRSVLHDYTGNAIQQPCSVGPLTVAPAVLGHHLDGGDGNDLRSMLQNLAGQLVPALPRVMQPVSAQLTRLPELSLGALGGHPQPSVAANDAVQMAALVSALSDPQHRFTINLPTSDLTPAPKLSHGKICKPSNAASGVSLPEEPAGPATTREKNRQAQQRFRQRQKDRIVELEQENSSLRDQLTKSDQQLAQARDEIRLLRAKLDGNLQLLESIQQSVHGQQQQQMVASLQQQQQQHQLMCQQPQQQLVMAQQQQQQQQQPVMGHYPHHHHPQQYEQPQHVSQQQPQQQVGAQA